MFVRVYNYNTMDKVKTFEAHTDYIRCVAAHPTLPYLLTSSDDMLIKLWDWDKGWACTQIFEGHSHYVMQVTTGVHVSCGCYLSDVCALTGAHREWCTHCCILRFRAPTIL